MANAGYKCCHVTRTPRKTPTTPTHAQQGTASAPPSTSTRRSAQALPLNPHYRSATWRKKSSTAPRPARLWRKSDGPKIDRWDGYAKVYERHLPKPSQVIGQVKMLEMCAATPSKLVTIGRLAQTRVLVAAQRGGG